jgi:hypothetical protein
MSESFSDLRWSVAIIAVMAGIAGIWALATGRYAIMLLVAVVELAAGAFMYRQRRPGANPYSAPRDTHFDR